MAVNDEKDIMNLLNSIYEAVQDAWTIPLGADKCIVEREAILDMLDEIRAKLPTDIKTARDIVEHRNELLAAGKREADAIKKQAEDYAKRLVTENEITVSAKRKANDMIAAAEMRAKELKRAANEYCDASIRRAEEAVANLLAEIRNARKQMRGIASKPSDTQSE